MEQHVSAAVDQRGGSFGFFGWVKPLIDPHHFGLDFGVDRLCAQGEGVDVADHFRNRNGSDHTQGVGLGHLASDHASHVRAFIGAAVVSAHVLCLLETSGMLELDVLSVSSHFEHGFHVAKGGAKNEFVALADHVAEIALGVGRLGNVFGERGFNFVAELGFQSFASVVVRKGPTAVAHRANVGKCNFQRLWLGSFNHGCRLGLFLFTASNHEGRSHHAQCSGTEPSAFVQICHEISLRDGKTMGTNAIMTAEKGLP